MSGVSLLLASSTFAAAQQFATAPPLAAQAMIFESRSDWSQAEKSWTEVAAQNPRDGNACAHLGFVLARENRLDDAVRAYRRALQLAPNIPGLQLNLGVALFKEEKLTEAIPPLLAAVAEAPADPQPRILLGMSYYGDGRNQEAIPYLRFGLASMPGNLPLRGTLAQICLNAKQYDCTLEQYHQIILIDPNSAQADMLAGEALDGLHRRAEAIAQFEAAARIAPNTPNVHFGLGYLEWKERQYDKAEEEFQRELRNEPDHAKALTYLGDIEFRLQQNAKAEADLRRAVRMAGAGQLAWIDLGRAVAADNHYDEAVSDFRHAIRMDPKEVEPHWRLAQLCQSMGKKDEAKAEFALAATLKEKEDDSLAQQLLPLANRRR